MRVINAQVRIYRFKTDLKYVAQNTHSRKSLRYLFCVLSTLCNAGTHWMIVQVFDRVHLKLDGPGKQR